MIQQIFIINIDRMNSTPTFSQAISEYIWKALHIWPALQLSLSQLSQSSPPPQDSPIKHQNFSNMSKQQFLTAITKDLHDYIMEHDVKTQHIVDFLIDVLAILNSEQQNEQTMTHMAKQLVSLIKQVPDGNYQRLQNLRHLYDSLKGQNLQHKIIDNREESEEDEHENCGHDHDHDHCHGHDHEHSEQDDEYSDEDEDDSGQMKNQSQPNKIQSENTSKIEEQVPKLIGQQQKMEDDDGWVVVKKKSKR